tara:strand:- start:1178 stop:1507 length:330 start_codon:yes stop_codon:yes gene_type:complete
MTSDPKRLSKTYSYKELHDIVDFVYHKMKKQTYLAVFVMALISPLIVDILYSHANRSPLFSVFAGATICTFLMYTIDQTIISYQISKVSNADLLIPEDEIDEEKDEENE